MNALMPTSEKAQKAIPEQRRPPTREEREAIFAAAIAEGRHSDGIWRTVCDCCREWVEGIYHGTLDGKAWCRSCAEKNGVEVGPPKKKRIPIGPFAPEGSTCAACGRAAVCECQTCKATYCVPHWHRHSHTVTEFMTPDGPVPVT